MKRIVSGFILGIVFSAVSLVSQEPLIPVAEGAVAEEDERRDDHDREQGDEHSHPLAEEVVLLVTGLAEIDQEGVRTVVICDRSRPDDKGDCEEPHLPERKSMDKLVLPHNAV